MSKLIPLDPEHKQYLGIKLVYAKPRPANEQDRRGIHPIGAEGYEIIYPDGYSSWSPKETFEKANQPVAGMTFFQALAVMEVGYRICNPQYLVTYFCLAEATDKADTYEIPVIDGQYPVSPRTVLVASIPNNDSEGEHYVRVEMNEYQPRSSSDQSEPGVPILFSDGWEIYA